MNVKEATISAVIPVFNEEAGIVHTVACVTRSMEAHASDYELILVDDASTDNTVKIIQDLASCNERIRLLRHAQNGGLGRSLRTGIEAATMNLVFYTDADLPCDPDGVSRAIRAMEVGRADIIAGYRLNRGAEGRRRSVYSRIYNRLIRLLFGGPHRDVNCPFKLMKRSMLHSLDLQSEGLLIDAEILTKARNLGFVIQQIGVDFFPRTRGKSTLSSPRVILALLRELRRFYSDVRNPESGPASTSNDDAKPDSRPV
jgi:glycosyltransferase involved in cell wall biosynthesis